MDVYIILYHPITLDRVATERGEIISGLPKEMGNIRSSPSVHSLVGLVEIALTVLKEFCMPRAPIVVLKQRLM